MRVPGIGKGCSHSLVTFPRGYRQTVLGQLGAVSSLYKAAILRWRRARCLPVSVILELEESRPCGLEQPVESRGILSHLSISSPSVPLSPTPLSPGSLNVSESPPALTPGPMVSIPGPPPVVYCFQPHV